jgi:hypothetical protein
MMMSYETYVREHFRENNPETSGLLERVCAFLETSEACAGVLDVFNSKLGGTYPERLDGLGGYLDANGSPGGSLNTFPFGKPTRHIYPDFVGVCRGERSIRSVLDKAEDQCEKMIDAYPDHVPKTILILTDKWDDPLFRKNYAGTFINYAYRHNIVFVFLLVTDSGVSRIPFLSWDRRKINSGGQGTVAWGARHAKKETYKNLMEKLDHGCLSYVEEYRNGDNNGHSIGKFIFDLRNQAFDIVTINSGSGITDRKSGKIPAGAVKKFLEAVSDYCELPESGYYDKNNPDKASVCHTAEMFNKRFYWYAAEDPLFEKLEQAFRNLLASLKMKK